MGGPGACRLLQRGAALLDLTVGAAVALVIFGLLVTLLHALTMASASRHALMLARTGTEQLLERMRSETASAWGIAVPASDLEGQSNADGHELDFTTQDATRRTYHWAYRYDAVTQSVTRYAVAPGASPQPGAVLSGITAFSATAYAANAIADASSPIYDPLFAGASVVPISYELNDGSFGGNGFVEVSIAAAGVARSELLSTSVAPTQFTVVIEYTPSP